MPDSLFARQGHRNDLDDTGSAAADAGILDGVIETQQFQILPPHHQVFDRFICRHVGVNTTCQTLWRTAHRGFGIIIKEIDYGHIRDMTDLPQAGRADLVGAALIFLQLLKSYI